MPFYSITAKVKEPFSENGQEVVGAFSHATLYSDWESMWEAMGREKDKGVSHATDRVDDTMGLKRLICRNEYYSRRQGLDPEMAQHILENDAVMAGYSLQELGKVIEGQEIAHIEYRGISDLDPKMGRRLEMLFDQLDRPQARSARLAT